MKVVLYCWYVVERYPLIALFNEAEDCQAIRTAHYTSEQSLSKPQSNMRLGVSPEDFKEYLERFRENEAITCLRLP